MKKIVLMFLVVFSFLVMSVSHAASKEDALRAVKLMRSSARSEKVLSFKDFKGGSFQCVYVVDGKRYTAYYNHETAGGWLSFWVRPNGTYGQKLIKTFSDHRLDGKVEFGVGGGKEEKLFDSESRNIGLEFQRHWQSQYDEAIKVAIAQLEQSSK